MNSLSKVTISALIALFIISNAFLANGQAKNAIGFGVGANTSGAGGGGGAVFQGEIKVTKSFSIVPSVGVEVPYVGYVGLAGKYYIAPRFYSSLGALAYFSGDDAGIGGSMALGYEVLSTRRHIIDLALHGDAVKISDSGGNTGAIVGLRLIYNFSFSKRY